MRQCHLIPMCLDSAAILNSFVLKIKIKISLLHLSLLQYKHFCEEIQTRQYRSLEVLLGSEYGPPADIWSVACLVREILIYMMFALCEIF